MFIVFSASSLFFLVFFFHDTATTEIYTLSLHDALPISLLRLRDLPPAPVLARGDPRPERQSRTTGRPDAHAPLPRSEEHTSELQSPVHLVCRLLLEKKKKNKQPTTTQSTNTTREPTTLT